MSQAHLNKAENRKFFQNLWRTDLMSTLKADPPCKISLIRRMFAQTLQKYCLHPSHCSGEIRNFAKHVQYFRNKKLFLICIYTVLFFDEGV